MRAELFGDPVGTCGVTIRSWKPRARTRSRLTRKSRSGISSYLHYVPNDRDVPRLPEGRGSFRVGNEAVPRRSRRTLPSRRGQRQMALPLVSEGAQHGLEQSGRGIIMIGLCGVKHCLALHNISICQRTDKTIFSLWMTIVLIQKLTPLMSSYNR